MKVYVVYIDIESVDRIFSTYEKAKNYIIKTHIERYAVYFKDKSKEEIEQEIRTYIEEFELDRND